MYIESLKCKYNYYCSSLYIYMYIYLGHSHCQNMLFPSGNSSHVSVSLSTSNHSHDSDNQTTHNATSELNSPARNDSETQAGLAKRLADRHRSHESAVPGRESDHLRKRVSAFSVPKADHHRSLESALTGRQAEVQGRRSRPRVKAKHGNHAGT